VKKIDKKIMFLGLFLVGLLVASGCEQQLAPKRDGLSQYAIRSGEIYSIGLEDNISVSCNEVCNSIRKTCVHGNVLYEYLYQQVMTLPSIQVPCHQDVLFDDRFGIPWVTSLDTIPGYPILRDEIVAEMYLFCECI
jgi:hypothetical protein